MGGLEHFQVDRDVQTIELVGLGFLNESGVPVMGLEAELGLTLTSAKKQVAWLQNHEVSPALAFVFWRQ